MQDSQHSSNSSGSFPAPGELYRPDAVPKDEFGNAMMPDWQRDNLARLTIRKQEPVPQAVPQQAPAPTKVPTMMTGAGNSTGAATGIEATLAERQTRYGDFDEHARITQAIKRAMVDSPNWKQLADDQKEALEMVAHKVGRILNGDPDYHDSWHDMIGYTKLVADRLVP